MHKVFCIVSFFLSCIICLAQQNVATITLKSGTTITGTIVELDPTSHLVIKVAGIVSRVEIGDVASISDTPSAENINAPISNDEDSYSPIDSSNYPDTYSLDVGPYKIEMILVRGATFEMGFDGKGSLKMKSEPIHKVQLHSFYVNKSPLSKSLVAYLKTGSEDKNYNDRRYSPGNAKNAINVVKELATKTNLDINLISEAQCEYILTTDYITKLDVDKVEYVWCRDLFANYTKSKQPVVDPVGPTTGKGHPMLREFSATNENVYTRYEVINNSEFFLKSFIRFTIPASILFQ